MQCSPSVRVSNVDVSITSKDSIECGGLVSLRLARQHGLMDGSLVIDRASQVDLLAAVDEVLELLLIRQNGGLVQSLQDVTGELVFADLQRWHGVCLRRSCGTMTCK